MDKENQEEKDLRKQVNEIYTPLSVAKKEIWRRWNDKELRKKVENFLETKLPKFLDDGPKVCLGRNIASPNFELKYFLDLARETNLSPVFIEHINDKFVAKNSDKYYLARLYFYNGTGKKRGDKITAVNIIDFNKCQGKTFKKINTLWGENIINFHHRILENNFPGSIKNIFDISCMLDDKKRELSEYYYIYLAIFMCGGILFENYPFIKDKEEFTSNVVIPCCSMLEKKFGVKPLIVPLEPIEDEINLYWWSYPENIKEFIK